MRKTIVVAFDSVADMVLYESPMNKTEARRYVDRMVPNLLQQHMTKLSPELALYLANEIDHILEVDVDDDYDPYRHRLIYAMDVLDGRRLTTKRVPVADIPADMLERCLKRRR